MPLIKNDNSMPLRGVEAKKRKRQRKRAFYLALTTLLVAVATIITITLFFNVEHIVIEGTSKYTNEQVIDASGIAMRSNMFKIDKFKVIDEMEKILPYIQNITINRKLPTTIAISYEEAKDATFIATAGGYTIMSEQDKILANVKEKPAIPELIGSGIVANTVGEKAVFTSDFTKDMFDKLYAELKNTEIISRLTKINISKSYNMAIEIENNTLVLMGTSEDLPRKTSFLKFILSKEDTAKDYNIIDIGNTESSRASVKKITKGEYEIQLAKLNE